MKQALLAVAAVSLVAPSACGNLPPGHVPVQATASQGGGAAVLQSQDRFAVP